MECESPHLLGSWTDDDILRACSIGCARRSEAGAQNYLQWVLASRLTLGAPKGSNCDGVWGIDEVAIAPFRRQARMWILRQKNQNVVDKLL